MARALNADEIDAVIRSRNQGRSVEEISKKYGISRPTVCIYAPKSHPKERYLPAGQKGWNEFKRGCYTCAYGDIIRPNSNYNDSGHDVVCMYIMEGKGRRPCKACDCTVYKRMEANEANRSPFSKTRQRRVSEEKCKEFGSRLRGYRESKGLSKRRMGKYLGVNPESYIKWENGNMFPTDKKLEQLSKGLGVDKDELVKGILY